MENRAFPQFFQDISVPVQDIAKIVFSKIKADKISYKINLKSFVVGLKQPALEQGKAQKTRKISIFRNFFRNISVPVPKNNYFQN